MLQPVVALPTVPVRPRTAYIVDGAVPDDVTSIVAALRGSDRFEAQAVGFDAERDIPLMVRAAADVYTAYLDDEPVFIFGTVEMHSGVRQLIGFGTDKTRRVIPSVTWFTQTHWLPEMFESGVRRIQVHIPAEAQHSLKWLKSFGMYVECQMKHYAAIRGVTMLQLAYTSDEYEHHVLRSKVGTSAGGDTSAGQVEC